MISEKQISQKRISKLRVLWRELLANMAWNL